MAITLTVIATGTATAHAETNSDNNSDSNSNNVSDGHSKNNVCFKLFNVSFFVFCCCYLSYSVIIFVHVQDKHFSLTSGVMNVFSPFPAPSKVTPRKNKIIRITYGNVAVKYTA